MQATRSEQLHISATYTRILNGKVTTPAMPRNEGQRLTNSWSLRSLHRYDWSNKPQTPCAWCFYLYHVGIWWDYAYFEFWPLFITALHTVFLIGRSATRTPTREGRLHQVFPKIRSWFGKTPNQKESQYVSYVFFLKAGSCPGHAGKVRSSGQIPGELASCFLHDDFKLNSLTNFGQKFQMLLFRRLATLL